MHLAVVTLGLAAAVCPAPQGAGSAPVLVEAFDEGPPLRAELIPGTGDVHFVISTTGEHAQRLFDQGVGQLHGGSLYEAERSFHSVAALDPECAIAYWGMAMANVHNRARARRFAWEAFRRRDLASPRERMYIEAYARFFGGEVEPPPPPAEETRRLPVASPPVDPPQRARLQRDLAALVAAFPTDVEARAFTVREGEHGEQRRQMLAEILSQNPRHPALRYGMAAPGGVSVPAWRVGASAPALGRMWSAGGRDYATKGRDGDAVWMFEAAVRTDHARMQRTGAMPYDVTFYANHQARLCGSLIEAGRVRAAVALAKTMVALPRHPYRSDHSTVLGARYLVEALACAELWGDLVALADGPWLESASPVERAYTLGRAHAVAGRPVAAREQLAVLSAGGAAAKEARERLAALVRLSEGDREDAHAMLVLGGYPDEHLAVLSVEAGSTDFALEIIADVPMPETVYGLAVRAWVEWVGGRQAGAKTTFARLRSVAGMCDLDVPPMQRLAPIARAMGLPEDWRQAPSESPAVEQLPRLAAVGPAQWTPRAAKPWQLPQGLGRDISLADYRGKPVLVVFFLGFG